MLAGKNVLLGITGGIAAYKIPDLIRRIRCNGGEVRCIVTEAGLEFVSRQVLQTLTGHPPLSSLFAEEFSVEHIEVSRWAHCFVIAPATANTLAKMAHGIADSLLTTAYLAFGGPVLVAPTMNTVMWEHCSVQANLKLLQQRGAAIIEPGEGALACGETGKGRMAEPGVILDWIARSLSPSFMAGKKVLITAGPTREHIDPVRFVSNASSGKMGFSLAKAAWMAGARVTLISGPVERETPVGVERINVVSSNDMLAAVTARFNDCDIFISNAAVADFAPESFSAQKAGKAELGNAISVRPTVDILAWAGEHKGRKTVVGFALETRNGEALALEKMRRKNCDFMALNNPFLTSGGVGTDNNAVTLLGATGKICDFENQPKAILAQKILAKLFGPG